MTGFCVRRSALVSELRRAFYIMIYLVCQNSPNCPLQVQCAKTY